ncbi:6815_t:CDS:2, partial [Gigaspora margarita]
ELEYYFLFTKENNSSDSQIKATTTFPEIGSLAAFGRSLFLLRGLVINQSDKDRAEKTFEIILFTFQKIIALKYWLDSLELLPLLFNDEKDVLNDEQNVQNNEKNDQKDKTDVYK